jgi:O-antigen/teichoic acid export membrane protein
MERLLPLRKSSGDFRGVLRDLFHFSKHIFFTRLANIVSARMSQFLLGTLSSVANVALYEVPVRAAETASVMLNRILQVLFPGFASMDKTTQAERIRSIFLSVLSLQLLIATPFLVMAVLEGPALLAAWINEDFSRSSSGIITLVAATYFISTLTNLPVFAVMSFGLPQLVSKYSIIRMAITLVLAYPLVKGFGLAGAAWVLLLSELQAFGLIYESAKRLFGMNVYRELARAIFIHAFVGVSLFVVYHWVYRHSALYTPLGVLAIAVLHPVLAIALKATTAADNRRLRNLVLAWQ